MGNLEIPREQIFYEDKKDGYIVGIYTPKETKPLLVPRIDVNDDGIVEIIEESDDKTVCTARILIPAWVIKKAFEKFCKE